MKQNKIYPHILEERGFKELHLREMSECQLSKSAFVERYVSPTVKHADSGWKGAEYAAYSNGQKSVFFHEQFSQNFSFHGIILSSVLEVIRKLIIFNLMV